eukprot:TRINITY_DN106604_c0_g1_i1.p1 TRINITY_DN106604_c0_g1~~TRINITY_DN106604_c0_g1_i1.p1  ORF type:complete len:620 (-),score=87.83 TRINITY_DN106604_c0_g1_i1:202-2061(-)
MVVHVPTGNPRKTSVAARVKAARKQGLDDDDELHSGWRRRVRQIVRSSRFESLVGLVIILNFVTILAEANVKTPCVADESLDCASPALDICNALLLVFYTVEAAMRATVYRWQYIRSFFGVLDLVIVAVGYVDFILVAIASDSVPAVQILRIFRVLRMVRAMKLVKAFPELDSMIHGFAYAASAMLWGFAIILMLLLIWSSMAVEFLYPVSVEAFGAADQCSAAFSDVWQATLLFFQTLVAGDSWGECSIQLINVAPLSFILFAGSLISIQLGFTNLILAVIVERAREAHEQDIKSQIAEAEQQRANAEATFRDICTEIDLDGDGAISLDEMMCAFDDHPEMAACLRLLDLDKSDMGHLYNIMDADNSGDLTFEEICSFIHKSDSQDVRAQIMMLRLQIEDVWVRVRDSLEVTLNDINQKLTAALGAEPSQPTETPSSERIRHHSLRSISSNTSGNGRKGSKSSQPQAVPEPKDKGFREVSKESAPCSYADVLAGSVRQTPNLALELEQMRLKLDRELRALATKYSRSVSAFQGESASEPASWRNAQVLWGSEHAEDPVPEKQTPGIKPAFDINRELKQSAVRTASNGLPAEEPRSDDQTIQRKELVASACALANGDRI